MWRAIKAGYVTLQDCENGNCTIDDILRINALLDMEYDLSTVKAPKNANS